MSNPIDPSRVTPTGPFHVTGVQPAPIIPETLATWLNVVQADMHRNQVRPSSETVQGWMAELREIELRLRSIPVACPLCGQHITDGKPCGCGARPVEPRTMTINTRNPS